MEKTKSGNYNVETTRKIRTTRFGQLEYKETDLVAFVRGLLGFEDLRRYLIIERDRSRPFIWLQSVDNPAVALPVVDPLFVKPDYAVKVQAGDLADIGITDASQARTFVIATIPHSRPQNISVNLLGPIIINTKSRRAVQIALSDPDYTTKYYLLRDRESVLPSVPEPENAETAG